MMALRRRRTVVAWSITLVLLAPSGFLSAQGQAGWPVTGTVVDGTGGVLPDAHLDLRDGSGRVVESTLTDGTGAFRLESVPPGRYDVLVTFPGFNPTTARVTVGTRAPSALRVTLPLAAIQQQVTVGRDVADVNADSTSNLDAATIDQDAIAKLPILDQDVLGTMARFLDASAIGAGGTTLIVNGIEVNALNFSASAIQQIKINQDPYSAEFARPGRGRIEVITKPGSQVYHGTANLFVRDAALDARNAFASTRPAEHRRTLEGFLSGPVRQSDATSFALSMRRDANDRDAIVVAQDLSGAIRQSVAVPSRNLLLSGTVTHQQSKNTTIVGLSYRNEATDNQGIGGFTLPTAATNWHQIEQEATYTQQTTVTPALLNQFRLLIGNEWETTTSLAQSPSVVVLDAFTGGGAQGDALRTEHHVTLTDTVTWTSGRHVLKTGFNVPDWSRRRYDDNTNIGGTFYFSGLSDYGAARPYAFVQQVGNGHVAFLEKQLGGFVQDDIRLRPNLSVALGVRYDWQNFVRDTNNVGPRASFAFAPTASGATVLRGGAGLFYDRTGVRPIQDVLRYDGVRLLRYVVLAPAYPDAFLSGQAPAAQPASIVTFAPDLQIPSTLQYSLSWERQLRKRTSVSVSYTGSRGFNQFRSRDINAPVPPIYAVRPYPTWGVWREIESAGISRSQWLQLTLRGQVTRFFNGSVQYALSRAMSDTGGLNWMPPNSYDVSQEYARSDGDQRHRFDLLGTINPGSLFNLGVAVALYSGRPYSILTGHDNFNTGSANARPVGVPRNSLEGPGYADVDLRWSRDIRLTGTAKEGSAVTVGIDAFNVLNRVNPSRYIGTLTSPFFGRAVSVQPPRRIQLSVRVRF